MVNPKSIVKRMVGLFVKDKGSPDALTVRAGSHSLQFETRSEIAKRWFYPRYADGTPHEPPIVDWLLQRINAETQFLDVGANVGFYTVLAASVCSRGRVIAVDVDPRLICEIIGNISAGGLSNAEAICGAAWDRSGDVLVFQPEQTDNLSTNRVVSNQTNSAFAATNVGCVSFTIDALCHERKFRPTAAKIDVEGAEPQVLRGMTDTLPGLSTLLLEIHPARIAETGEKISEIFQTLSQLRFDCRLVEDHRGQAQMRPLPTLEDWESISANGMVLCEKRTDD